MESGSIDDRGARLSLQCPAKVSKIRCLHPNVRPDEETFESGGAEDMAEMHKVECELLWRYALVVDVKLVGELPPGNGGLVVLDEAQERLEVGGVPGTCCCSYQCIDSNNPLPSSISSIVMQLPELGRIEGEGGQRVGWGVPWLSGSRIHSIPRRVPLRSTQPPVRGAQRRRARSSDLPSTNPAEDASQVRGQLDCSETRVKQHLMIVVDMNQTTLT